MPQKFQLSSDEMAILEREGLTYRFRSESARIIRDSFGLFEPLGAGKVYCHVIDRATGADVCIDSGPEHGTAFRNALDKSRTSLKPLTAAQAADPRYAKLDEVHGENERLRARLAELEGSTALADASTRPRPEVSPRKVAGFSKKE